MAGTGTTRKHARTHAINAIPLGACARAGGLRLSAPPPSPCGLSSGGPAPAAAVVRRRTSGDAHFDLPPFSLARPAAHAHY